MEHHAASKVRNFYFHDDAFVLRSTVRRILLTGYYRDLGVAIIRSGFFNREKLRHHLAKDSGRPYVRYNLSCQVEPPSSRTDSHTRVRLTSFIRAAVYNILAMYKFSLACLDLCLLLISTLRNLLSANEFPTSWRIIHRHYYSNVFC